MKVLLVGSKSIHISTFIESLNQEGIIPVLLTEEKVGYQKVEKEINVSFRSKNPLKIIFNYWKLKRIIKSEKPDIVNIHQVNRLAFFTTRICKSLNIKTVVNAWGTDVIIMPLKNKFFYFLVKQTLMKSDVLVVNSIHIKNAMLKIEPNVSKYIELHYGIEPLEEYSKEKIIYSNRLHKSFYRIDKVIHYFNDFQNDYPDWELVIAAEGPETNKIKALVGDLNLNDKVRFLGWIDYKTNTEWFKKAAIYISIPETDSISVSVLEAMSAGCFPIVPDLPVSKEIIEDGLNGVIEHDNPLRVAVNLLGNDYKKRNLEIINEKFTRSACTKKYIDVFKKVLN